MILMIILNGLIRQIWDLGESFFRPFLTWLPSRLDPMMCLLTGMGFSIVCSIYSAFQDPNGAINSFIIRVEDLVFGLLPSTPSQYKVSSMLISLSDQFPLIGWGTVKEIFSGISGIFSIWILWKMYRSLPFIGG